MTSWIFTSKCALANSNGRVGCPTTPDAKHSNDSAIGAGSGPPSTGSKKNEDDG